MLTPDFIDEIGEKKPRIAGLEEIKTNYFGNLENLLSRHLLRLRASLCPSKAVFFCSTSAPLATVFRAPLLPRLSTAGKLCLLFATTSDEAQSHQTASHQRPLLWFWHGGDLNQVVIKHGGIDTAEAIAVRGQLEGQQTAAVRIAIAKQAAAIGCVHGQRES